MIEIAISSAALEDPRLAYEVAIQGGRMKFGDSPMWPR
jgi:hypothetical protein